MTTTSTPTSITQYQTGYAPEIAPYAQSLLGAANATTFTTNPNQIDPTTGLPTITGFQPYVQYTGDQNAQFTPLQMQSFQGAQNMQTAPQLGAASDVAGMASMGALNTNYNYNPQSFTSPGTAQQYMNPYLMASLAPQLAIQQQLQGAAQQTQNAQAAQAGAFGGSRAGVQAAATGLNNQLSNQNLIGQGYNTAYNNAANQFNTEQQLGAQNAQFGANLGLQGLNTALQGANTLGTLGQNQYTQNMGINQLQNQYGGQQQQQMQNVLNTQYQNFVNAQNFPYQQMSYLSDLINKLPMSTEAQTMYQAPPSMLSQVGGLGIAAAGLSKALPSAKGGSTKDIKERKSNGLVDLALKKMEPTDA